MIGIRRADPDDLARIEEPQPDSAKAITIIAEDERGNIVGRILLVGVIHLEGIFVEPRWRGSTVMARLVEEAEREAKELGLTQVLAFGASPEMEGYIQRLGYNLLPFTIWEKKLA